MTSVTSRSVPAPVTGALAALLAVVVGVLAVGCSPDDDPRPPTTVPATLPTTVPTTRAPGAEAVPEPTVEVVATRLDAPWGLAALPDGRLLVTMRDRAEVLLLDPTTTPADRSALTGPGADALASGTAHGGEGGLLGVAVSPAFASDRRVFLYRTTSAGNEVVRAELDGTTLGPLTTVVDGIPAASVHDGGRLAFGPDGDLYVTTGDAVGGDEAQDLGSLGGKILRVTQDGDPAPGNPFAGSRVWSWGHRNVQGIGWAPDGTMFASEFGQNTYDELNVVVPGANYGWPVVEGLRSDGAGDDPAHPPDAYRDPVAVWATSDASPSGLAVTARAVYLAGLRGERLWRVPLTPDGVGEPQALLAGAYGRLRAVLTTDAGASTVTGGTGGAVGPEVLYVLTNDTDGRGSPSADDDRLLRVAVSD